MCKINSDNQISAIQFHPDGLLLASGHEDRSLSIWDIRTQQVFTTIKNDDIQGLAISEICFSNKGYQFAASWKGSNIVKLYDMRKNFTATCLEFTQPTVQSICFDFYGNYLAGAQGRNLRMFSGKNWTPQVAEINTDAPLSNLKFASDSLTLFGSCGPVVCSFGV